MPLKGPQAVCEYVRYMIVQNNNFGQLVVCGIFQYVTTRLWQKNLLFVGLWPTDTIEFSSFWRWMLMALAPYAQSLQRTRLTAVVRPGDEEISRTMCDVITGIISYWVSTFYYSPLRHFHLLLLWYGCTDRAQQRRYWRRWLVPCGLELGTFQTLKSQNRPPKTPRNLLALKTSNLTLAIVREKINSICNATSNRLFIDIYFFLKFATLPSNLRLGCRRFDGNCYTPAGGSVDHCHRSKAILSRSNYTFQLNVVT